MVIAGTGSQLRTLGMVFMHSFRKRETLNYPEEPVYLPPRYRGRIVLTRDPDGEERCVACNLCAVACPVACISLQKGEQEDGRWYPGVLPDQLFPLHFLRHVRRGLPDFGDPAHAGLRVGRVSGARSWSTKRRTC